MITKKLIELIVPFIVVLFLMLTPDNAKVFFFSSSVISLYIVKRWTVYIINYNEIELASFFSTCILSAYVFTAFTTQLNLFFQGYGYAKDYFNYDQFYLSVALAIVVISCLFLDILGIAKPTKLNFSKEDILSDFGDVVIFLVSGFVLVVYCFFSGLIGLQGDIFSSGQGNQVSALASIATFLLPLIGSMCFFIATANYNIKKIHRIIFFLLSIICVLFLFTQGRRLVMFAGVLYFISYRTSVDRNMISIKSIITVLCISLFVYFGFKYFFALRLASYQLVGSSLFELIPKAFDILFNPNDYDFSDQLSKNTLERPFIISYLAKLIELTNVSHYFWGESALNNFLLSIPSVLLEQKNFPVDEDLIHPRIGLTAEDMANSMLTAGIADFGFVGGIFFPLMGVFLAGLFIKLIFINAKPWFSFFSWLAFLYLFLSIESSITSYFLIYRNLLITMIFVKMFQMVYKPFISK